MLDSVREAAKVREVVTAKAVLEARRRRAGSIVRLVAAVTAYQLAAAQASQWAFSEALSEQGIDAPQSARPQVQALAGFASDGRSMLGLLTFAAAALGGNAFDRVVVTQVQDAWRQSGAIALGARPAVTGYVRTLTPPSCSRCAQLAGRVYRRNEGFDRHPGCDCVHIPTAGAGANDLTTDPREYFDSLPTAERLAADYPGMTVKQRRAAGLVSQEDVFTKAGAEAIRSGADISKVVNARAGMSTSQVVLRGPGDRWTAKGRLVRTRVFGQDVYTTTEAVGGRKVRLMPESILELAEDTADALRLLKAHGYLM